MRAGRSIRSLARAARLAGLAALALALAGCASLPPESGDADTVADEEVRAYLREVAQAAERGRPLTVTELLQVYEGRTWRWTDGAGYFDPAKRIFASWVRSGPAASYAEGAWFLTETGRMCFRATWTSIEGSGDALTCFEHRTDGERLLQQRLPDGDWYVFAHRPPQAGDEILKLWRGDYVYRNVERNRQTVRDALDAR